MQECRNLAPTLRRALSFAARVPSTQLREKFPQINGLRNAALQRSAPAGPPAAQLAACSCDECDIALESCRCCTVPRRQWLPAHASAFVERVLSRGAFRERLHTVHFDEEFAATDIAGEEQHIAHRGHCSAQSLGDAGGIARQRR